MKPLVSIIIPNYNHKIYLEERIQSILNQTFQDFEIIILDDCSTDSSYEIIEKYRNNPKVSQIIYNTINSGSTFIQWNKGFELAKGKYIWIAESDDFCEKELLELLVTKLEEEKNNVVSFCLSQFVDENGIKIPPFIKKENKGKIYNGRTFISLFMADANIINNASSALFRSDIIPLISPEYMKYKAAGDRLFWINLAKHGNVCMLKSPLNYFRQHQIKVSPSKLINGTTFYEDYNIVKSLFSESYISKHRIFFIKNHYINIANKINEMPNHVRENIYKLWKYPKFIPYKIISFIDLIYYYILRLSMKYNEMFK